MDAKTRALMDNKAEQRFPIGFDDDMSSIAQQFIEASQKNNRANFLAGAEARDELAKEREAKLVAAMRELVNAAERVLQEQAAHIENRRELWQLNEALTEHHAATGDK